MLDDELQTSILKQVHLPQDMDNVFVDESDAFEEMMMMYSCVLRMM